MRRLRDAVVSSLDGYIAGPEGEADWILLPPDKDFGKLFQQFDTVLIGRRTFDGMVQAGQTSLPGMKLFVVSHSLAYKDYPGVNLVANDLEQCISGLKEQPGEDIWLFGGEALVSISSPRPPRRYGRSIDHAGPARRGHSTAPRPRPGE